MENASKALLIAAAILIAILLIAFGMRIVDSSGISSGDAETVGNTLTTQTGAAKNQTMKAMGYEWNETTKTWVKK